MNLDQFNILLTSLKRFSLGVFTIFILLGWQNTLFTQCVPLSPDPVVTLTKLGRTITYSNVSINGMGNTATLAPGQAFSVDLDFLVDGTITACTGCVTYAYFGIGLTSVGGNTCPAPLWPDVQCMGSIFGGQNSNSTGNFNAPMTPGYYYISTAATWTYCCHQSGVNLSNCYPQGIGLIIVGNAPSLAANTVSVTPSSSCTNNGAINIAASGGTGCYEYTWSNGESIEDISNLAPGNYSVTISDAGCTESLININVPAGPPASIFLGNDTSICDGDTVFLDATLTGATYEWQDLSTDSVFAVTVSGNYAVTVTLGSCILTDDINVTVYPHGGVDFGPDTTLCGNDVLNMSLNAGPAFVSYDWSTGETSQIITVPDTGTYFVEVEEISGCLIRDTIVIAQYPPMDLNIVSVNPVSCFAGNDGDAEVVGTGGIPGYLFEWSNTNPVITTETASGLPTGAYTVTMEDITGCTDQVSLTINQPSAPLSLSPGSDLQHVSCYDGDNGIACIGVTGGTLPYTLLWDNGETTDCISDLIAGDYGVTVTDFNNCQASLVITLTQPLAELDVLIDQENDVSCFNFNNGSAVVSSIGGTRPYNYTWSTVPVQFGSGAYNLLPGIYHVTVEDVNGCKDSIPATILNQPELVVQFIDSQMVACNGGNNAFLEAEASGGNPNYIYSWSNNPFVNTPLMTNLYEGNYTVTVSDNNGCQTTHSIYISEPPPLLVNFSINPVDCYQNSTGSATVNVVGGNGNYSYVWSNNTTGPNINNLSAGTYYITITDTFFYESAPGVFQYLLCQALDSAKVNEPAPFDLELTVEDVLCQGEAEGTVLVSITGGTTPYFYELSSGPFGFSPFFAGLSAGDYDVTITDQNGCAKDSSFTINEPPAMYLLGTAQPVSCFGQADGSASVEVIGGIPPFTYQWSTSPVQFTPTAIDLLPGPYEVTVTDSNNCTRTLILTVNEPGIVDPVLTTTDVSCYGFHDGALEVNVNGGTPPFFYQLNPGGTVGSVVSNLSEGFYTLITTDSSGCSNVTEFEIGEPSTISLTGFSTPDRCNIPGPNGEAWVNISGGTPPYTVVWNTSPLQTTVFINQLPPGEYDCTVTDAQGCSQLLTVIVEEITAPVASIVGDPSFCEGENGDTLVVMGAGGTEPYFANWTCANPPCGLNNINSLEPIAIPTSTDSFFVQLTDVNGCMSEVVSVIVEVLPKPIVNAGRDTVICGDDAPCMVLMPEVDEAPGPYLYQWYPITGEYNDQVANPCVRPDSTTIYTLVATSSNGCSSELTTVDTQSTVIVEVNPIPVVDAGDDLDLCFGDDITLLAQATGAGPIYEFEWSPATGLSDPLILNPDASPEITTEYTLVVWSNRCPSYADNMIINVHTRPTVSIDLPADICYGDTTLVIGYTDGDLDADDYTFQWTPLDGIIGPNDQTSILVSPDSTTTYYITSESNFICGSFLDSVVVTVKPAPLPEAGLGPLYLCGGNSVTLPGSLYYPSSSQVTDPSLIFTNWSPSEIVEDPGSLTPSVQPELSTWFTLSSTYQNCYYEDSILVTVFPELNASAEADTTTSCSGDSIQLVASGGVNNPNYDWSPSTGMDNPSVQSPWVMPETTTTYTVIISEGGCLDTAAITVGVIPRPKINYFSSLREGCIDFPVDFIDDSDSNIVLFRWEFGDGTVTHDQHPSYTFTEPGVYNVVFTGTNSGGCESQADDIFITVHDSAVAKFTSTPSPGSTIQIPGTEVSFQSTSENTDEWFWDFGDGGFSREVAPDHTFYSEGQYYVKLRVTNPVGCMDEVVLGPYIVELAEVMIPNVFSPNGDGIQDVFKINYSGNQPVGVGIFDRWGEEVFASQNLHHYWDGKNMTGQAVAEGVYYYIIHIGDKMYSGNITLLR